MADKTNSADTLKAILVLLATIGTIAFNVLAANGFVNGVTPEAISDRYPTVLTPAGYAFSIWSLIYAGTLAFSVYQLLPANRSKFRSIRSAYIASSVLNCLWIYFWHHDLIAVCLAVILGLLGTLIFICRSLIRTESPGELWAAKAPFGLYAGWVTCATIINFLVLLIYLRVDLTADLRNSLGAALILLAAGIAVLARVYLKNYFYPLAVAWALTAIAVKQSGNTPIVVAAAVGVIASLITSLSFVVTLPLSQDRAAS